MILARTVGGPAYLEMIEEVDRELVEFIEHLGRATNVEALRLAKRSSKHASSHSGGSDSERLRLGQREQERDEHGLLIRRLKPIATGYHQDFRCMEGTRDALLREIMDWVASISKKDEVIHSNTYWIYGPPGIGKTSLAHSICARLDDQRQLVGGLFCQRDDADLSEPRNILPTLIHTLAIIFPPFRSIVAERLSKDPNVTPESMKHTFLLELIHNIPHPPNKTVVFVIDALDECGSAQSRPGILNALTTTAAHTPWLKMIITSRPEDDIQHYFNGITPSTHFRYDLAANKEATSDLRIFAKHRFSRVVSKLCLQPPWPEQSLFDATISRSEGLFTFIETIALALELCEDPTELLKATLQDSTGTDLRSLSRLYSSILKARIVHSSADFRRMIGVLLITAPNRPLCEETIAELAGVKTDLVRTWVADLGSMLYEWTGGGIRVRHLSVSDFFVSDDCQADYQVNLLDANVELGIACLHKMVEQLRFNICELEDSRLANNEVEDLPSRIKGNISDALQYSCLYWSNHLCFTPGNGDRRVWESLRVFFEGPYALFWIEVLSIMGMSRIGVLSLRKLTSVFVKVSIILACCRAYSKVIITHYRMPI